LTGDRARERGAENRADAPMHLIKRSQELKAGKYAHFTYSLSPFIFLRRKKKKLGKLGEKKEKEKEKTAKRVELPIQKRIRDGLGFREMKNEPY